MTAHNSIERFYDQLDKVINVNFINQIAIEGIITHHYPKFNCYTVTCEKYTICCRYINEVPYKEGDKVRIIGNVVIHSDTCRVILNIAFIVKVSDDEQINDIMGHYRRVEKYVKETMIKSIVKKKLPLSIQKIAFVIPEFDQLRNNLSLPLASINAEITIKEIDQSPSVITCFEKNTQSILRLLSDKDMPSLAQTIKLIDEIQFIRNNELKRLFDLTNHRIMQKMSFYHKKLHDYEKRLSEITGKVYYSELETKLMMTILKMYQMFLKNTIIDAEITLDKYNTKYSR